MRACRRRLGKAEADIDAVRRVGSLTGCVGSRFAGTYGATLMVLIARLEPV